MATIQAGAFHRRNKVSRAFEQVAVGTTPTGFNPAIYSTFRYAEITVEGANVRFTCDGTPPSATVGHLVNIVDIIRLDSNEDIQNFRAVSLGAGSVVIATYQEMKLTA